MSVFVPEVQAQAKAVSLFLARGVPEYFRNEEHRREFEDWYRQKYDNEYTWESLASLTSEMEKICELLLSLD